MATVARGGPGLVLFSGEADIASHQVRLMLQWKGLAYQRVLVRPGPPPEDLLDLNPEGSVPTLVERHAALVDASVICEYLNERYPHPPMSLTDPVQRAGLRILIRRIERDWLPQIEQIVHGRPAERKRARQALRDELLLSVPLFKGRRPYLLEEQPSLLDCLMLPIVWRLPWLGVRLETGGQVILDYGEGLFHSQLFTRSMTNVELAMRHGRIDE